MMCEKCGKNPATTHIKQSVNGNTTEWNVCSECASSSEIKNLHDMFMGMGFNFGDFWGNLFAEQPQIAAKDSVKCSGCGISFADIIKSGKVGCADCYTAFYDQLLPTIQKVHGNTRHTGKIPAGAGEGLRKEREIDELRRQLAKFISEQRYEECARIRDQIEVLENALKLSEAPPIIDVAASSNAPEDNKEVTEDGE